jgi:proteasome alpha subunit
LIVQKRFHSSLIEPEMVKKIYAIDGHLAVAIAGLTADARILVNQARIQAQIHRITYAEEISVEGLTRRIADLKQMYTQHAGVRPFGVSMLIAGCDDNRGPQVFMTEPSGSYWGYRAAAIGSSAPAIIEYLENEYQQIANTVEEGSMSALRALTQVSEGPLNADLVEIGVIDKTTKTVTYLDKEDITKLVEKLKEA